MTNDSLIHFNYSLNFRAKMAKTKPVNYSFEFWRENSNMLGLKFCSQFCKNETFLGSFKHVF